MLELLDITLIYVWNLAIDCYVWNSKQTKIVSLFHKAGLRLTSKHEMVGCIRAWNTASLKQEKG